MKNIICKLMTDGSGFWTTKKQRVSIISIEKNSKELRVYFDPKDWDIKKNGLIYTDPLFLSMLQSYLKSKNETVWNKIDYSEYGMQGNDYVSLDILD